MHPAGIFYQTFQSYHATKYTAYWHIAICSTPPGRGLLLRGVPSLPGWKHARQTIFVCVPSRKFYDFPPSLPPTDGLQKGWSFDARNKLSSVSTCKLLYIPLPYFLPNLSGIKIREGNCVLQFFFLARTKIGRQRLPDRHQHHRPHIDSTIRCDTNTFFSQNDYKAKEHFSRSLSPRRRLLPHGRQRLPGHPLQVLRGEPALQRGREGQNFSGLNQRHARFRIFFFVCRPRQASQYAVKITHKSLSQEKNICCPCFVLCCS